MLADGLSQAQIAALQYHGQLQLVRSRRGEAMLAAACRTMVVNPASQATSGERR